jgi:hypothetical protein
MKHAPPPIDDDLQFFLEHPHVSTRTRFLFPDEFPGVFEGRGGAFVIITIERMPNGWPKRRARRHLHFCDGGTA